MRMDESENSNPHDIASVLIRRFLDTVPAAETELDERSLVARLCAEEITVFRIILRHLPEAKHLTGDERKIHTSLRRSYGRLVLWSEGCGVATGKLDAIFMRAKGLRHATLKILIAISRTLTLGLIPLVDAQDHISRDQRDQYAIWQLKSLTEGASNDQDGQDSSDDSELDYEWDSLREVGEDLETDSSCLLELDPLIKSPVLDVEVEEPATGIPGDSQIWEPHLSYSHKISNRFPQANEELVSRLGRANYSRYLRCQKQRDNQAPDNRVLDPTLAKSELGNSSYHDSGLGSSLPTSYAETVMSYHAGPNHSVRIPPLPPQAKEGKSFPCVVCGRSVIMASNSQWKHHLYEDLQPWMCLDKACSVADKTFSSQKDWTSHLALDHRLEPEWESQQCPLCLTETGAGKISVIKHLGGHLEEISLAAVPPNLELDSASDDSGPEAANDVLDSDNHADPKPQMKEAEVQYDDAVAYVDLVKERYSEDVDRYRAFLKVMKEYQDKSADGSSRTVLAETISRISSLFHDSPDLIMQFKRFIPKGYK